MPILIFLNTLYNNTKINTKTHFQNSQSQNIPYPLQQQKSKAQIRFAKMSSLTCVHTLYNNPNINTKTIWQNIQYCMYTYPIQQININTKALFQNSYLYMCKYPLQQHKHKHKGSLPKFPVLHAYIPSTTTQAQTQNIDAKIPSLTCVHTLYNNTNTNT